MGRKHESLQSRGSKGSLFDVLMGNVLDVFIFFLWVVPEKSLHCDVTVFFFRYVMLNGFASGKVT